MVYSCLIAHSWILFMTYSISRLSLFRYVELFLTLLLAHNGCIVIKMYCYMDFFFFFLSILPFYIPICKFTRRADRHCACSAMISRLLSVWMRDLHVAAQHERTHRLASSYICFSAFSHFGYWWIGFLAFLRAQLTWIFIWGNNVSDLIMDCWSLFLAEIIQWVHTVSITSRKGCLATRLPPATHFRRGEKTSWHHDINILS